ncbi:MAG: DEAD/DEAH box helicase [Prevotella sp.]|jgi:superfamily II DNA/RNA helicase|nr:DEAD/DEAH box helicase [Prevotella sp.]MCI2079527.1 DEAD/DEAH box helicase [Prevotella sp.]MCI2101558.1 DEAD/DEAH box helicase [Prevotella sp.]
MNNNLLQKMGIEELNAMQLAASEAILHSNKDVVVLSPTGSGKTIAYLLPLVQLLDASRDDVQAVVIVPGRELALQSATVLKDMGSGLRCCACYGGRAAMEEHRVLRQVRPQVVFATPGRLNDHLEKGNISVDSIHYLVIDEFDKCLEMGFSEEMSTIIGRLPAVQRHILLSATDAASIPQYVNMGRTIRVDYQIQEEQVPDRVQVYQVDSPDKDKLETLKALLLTLGNSSSIVFLNYRESVERTAEYLRKNGFSISMFHGGLNQKLREDALYKFSNGSANVLVCTDLASRGLDIPDIRNIIHYHLPESEEGYVHRVGRTARWKNTGSAFFILGPGEQIPDYVEGEVKPFEINAAGKAVPIPKMATLYIGKGKKDKISKGDIVGFLCKKADLQKEDIGRIDVKERYAYVAISRKKLNQTLQLTKGEKIKGIRTIVESVR